jgi:hypothetical protein
MGVQYRGTSIQATTSEMMELPCVKVQCTMTRSGRGVLVPGHAGM